MKVTMDRYEVMEAFLEMVVVVCCEHLKISCWIAVFCQHINSGRSCTSEMSSAYSRSQSIPGRRGGGGGEIGDSYCSQ